MKTCKTCKFFASYADIYNDDEYEPYDLGECRQKNIYPIPSDDCGIGWEDSCEHWSSEDEKDK